MSEVVTGRRFDGALSTAFGCEFGISLEAVLGVGFCTLFDATLEVEPGIAFDIALRAVFVSELWSTSGTVVAETL